MSLSDKKYKPVYYVYGAEDFLVESTVEGIRSGALEGGFDSMNYEVFDARTARAATVISAAETLPAFSSIRVVVVRGAESIKAGDEALYADYVQNPSDTTCLVFSSSAAKVKKTSKFIKLMSAKGYLKECRRLKDAELAGWVVREAKAQGKTMTAAAAHKLVAIAGNGLRDLKSELDKIIIYAGDKEAVDEKDVDGAGLDCREETIFALSDAIGSKDLGEAMRIYAKVSGEQPPKILGAVARQIRILLQLKALVRRGVGARELPKYLGVSPWHMDGYIKRSRRFSEAELARAIRRLSAADNEIKTGRLPQALALTNLIIELCTPSSSV